MNINIEPIKLLMGSHADTGQTGQGCFMNVIAYLNGEAQITDESPCVCAVVRPIAIWLNDYMRDDERQQLIPLMQRAMGSATDNKDDMIRRAWLAVDFADEMSEIDASAVLAAASAVYAASAASAARAAAAASAHYAVYAANAARAAVYAANAAAARAALPAEFTATDAEAHQKIIDAGIKFLDAALPPLEQLAPMSCAVESRAAELVKLNVEAA